jgi:hypothetical protein
MASSVVNKFLGRSDQFRGFEQRFLRPYMSAIEKPYGATLARYVQVTVPVQSVARKLKGNQEID